MTITGTYDTAYVEQLKADFMHELQQENGVMRPLVTWVETNGSNTFFGKRSKTEVYEKTVRNQKKEFATPNYEKRSFTKETNSYDEMFDPQDTMRSGISPLSLSQQAGVMAMHRKIDDIVIDKILGIANVSTSTLNDKQLQVENTTSVSLPAAQVIAVDNHGIVKADGTETGTNDICLTPGKLSLGMVKLGEAFTDLTKQINIVGSTNALARLASFDRVIHRDYNPSASSAVKKVPLVGDFMGMNYVICERVPLDENGDEQILMFANDAVYMTDVQPFQLDISPDKTRIGHPDVLSIWEEIGGVRMYEEKVVVIKADPSVNIPA